MSYIWARMMVIDEVGHIERHESLTFVDFLDALGKARGISIDSLWSFYQLKQENVII